MWCKDIFLSNYIYKIYVLRRSGYWIFCYPELFLNEDIVAILKLCGSVADSAGLLKIFVFVI